MFTHTHNINRNEFESDDELLIGRSRDGTGRNSHSPHSVVHVRSIAGAAAQILKQEMRCIPTTMFQPPLVVVFFSGGQEPLQVLFAFLYDSCLYYQSPLYFIYRVVFFTGRP